MSTQSTVHVVVIVHVSTCHVGGIGRHRSHGPFATTPWVLDTHQLQGQSWCLWQHGVACKANSPVIATHLESCPGRCSRFRLSSLVASGFCSGRQHLSDAGPYRHPALDMAERAPS